MIYKPYKHLVQYYETDQMGIVHHSNYIRWFEEARSYILEENGFGYKKMEELGIISPVLSVNARYKSMTHYYDTVIIKPDFSNLFFCCPASMMLSSTISILYFIHVFI